MEETAAPPGSIRLFTIPTGAYLKNLGNGAFRVVHSDGRVEEIQVFIDGKRVADVQLDEEPDNAA